MSELKCPVCNAVYPEDCEQGVAMKKRGKCIKCIIDAKEPIQMEPYEFESPKEVSRRNA